MQPFGCFSGQTNTYPLPCVSTSTGPIKAPKGWTRRLFKLNILLLKNWQILDRYLDTDETSVAASETATMELKGSY